MVTNQDKDAKPEVPLKARKKKELTSDRRQYKLMQVVSKVDVVKDKYDWSSSESSSEEEDEFGNKSKKVKEPRVLVVKSKYGKTRPLTETGKFSDRPPPTTKPPPNIQPEPSLSLEGSSTTTSPPMKGGQMPYVYASDKTGIVLTRGQYLDLAEAKEKKQQREEIRHQKDQEEKEIIQRWMCDPRITDGWTVHYSKEYNKCYFHNKETNETTWKPPKPKETMRPKSPNSKSKSKVVNGMMVGAAGAGAGRNAVRVEPKWIRRVKQVTSTVVNTVDKALPAPPRAIKRWRRQARFAASAVGLGACCGPRKVVLEGDGADETMEIVDALGLSQQDLHGLKEAFRQADWDDSGAMSAEEMFAWLKEPLTAYSRSIFKLADMDDSGLVDFTEFVKIVCHYCSYLEDDVLKYGFDLFDDDHSGTIDEYELSTLVEQMNGVTRTGENDAPDAGNIAEALKVIDQNGDGILDFPEFCQLCKRLPLVIFPAFRLQKALMRKTLGEGRWSFILWNVDRESRVNQYMRTHHGRRPAGNFKSVFRVMLETALPCVWPRLPRTFPDFVDGIRPASGDRPGGTYGGSSEKRPDVDTSNFAPASYS